MEDDILQQIVYSIQSGLGQVKEESHEFRLEAERQNFAMSKFMSDLSSKFFVTQNKQQADLNDSMDEVERQSAATNQNINELQSITQESVSLLSQISIQMKDMAQGIGSLVQLFQQNSGQSQFSFGGAVGGGLSLLGGAAAATAVGAGLSSLVSAGTASAGEMLPSGGGEFSTENVSGTTADILKTIRTRESGGDYGIESKSSSASGAYQFIDSTWQSLTKKYGIGADYSRAFMAPESIQDAVAAKYVEEILSQNNNDITKVPIVWYTGNSQGKLAPGALERNNGLTPQKYQEDWLNTFKNVSGSQSQNQNSQTPVEASNEKQDGKVVNAPEVTNSMGSLNSKGELGDRKGFIIHHTGGRGDVGGVINTLNQRGLSVQYVIDREGQIHQLMPSGSRASHMRKGQGVGAGLSNKNTEGVEIIAKDDSDVLPVQVEAAKRLAQQLGYAPNQVYGHGEVNPHKQKTEGATVVSAIRGGAPPANPSESQSASGSTGITGESGTATGGGEINPFAGTPFAGITSQISGALQSLAGFGQLGAGMLGGGMPMMGAAGMLGSAMPMVGSMVSSLSSVFSDSNNKMTDYKSDAQAVIENDKLSQVSEMSNNLTIEKTVAELTKQDKVQPATETSIQSRPVEGVKGATFTPTSSSSIPWIDRLSGRTSFPKFNLNGVYS